MCPILIILKSGPLYEIFCANWMRQQFYNYKFLFLSLLLIARTNWLSAQTSQFIPLTVSNTWSYEGESSSIILIEKDTVIDLKKSYKIIEKQEAEKRIDYFVISNDSVFIFRIGDKKLIFSHRENLKVGDTIAYRKEKGRVISLNAKLITPISQYSDLIKVKWFSSGGVIDFGYYKPGIGLIAYESEEGILVSYLVKYKVK